MMCKHCSAPILVDGTSLSDSSKASRALPNDAEPATPVTSKAPASADDGKPAMPAAAVQKPDPSATPPQVLSSKAV
ncbi:MAG: hypothetical protein ACM3ZE_24750, partial [Myxococcales bacterium]